ncbi:MAG TPA: hypothetical protein VMD74_04165 [Candidatus Methylomirabilis sp.]|nr:hypothetical protein [Candidatus Methylomirabilis sp.]
MDSASGLKNQPIAIDLYAQLADLPTEKRGRAEELILENFSFADGSYKKTHMSRFADFDREILEYLASRQDRNKLTRVHDLATSDGRTALDFFLGLEKKFPRLDFTASDKNISVFVFSDQRNNGRKIIKDREGKILQFIFPPFVLNVYSAKRAFGYKIKRVVFYPVNFILTKILLWPGWQKFYFHTTDNAAEIKLIDQGVLAAVAAKTNFHFLAYDLMAKKMGDFEIIRAMNILNPSYFSAAEIKQIAANIFSSLAENGWLIVGSNHDADSAVNGDLFLKKDGRLEAVKKFGTGAPFREIILAAGNN